MEVNGNEETTSTEVVKYTAPNDNEDPDKKVVSISVEYQDHRIDFKIKWKTPFTKLFKVYCERMVSSI
jgi:hypothetical protein